VVKKAKAHKIGKKRNGKFIVIARGGKLVNGPEKTKILQAAGKVKTLTPKKKDAPAEGAPA
jgi:hypothetical protein